MPYRPDVRAKGVRSVFVPSPAVSATLLENATVPKPRNHRLDWMLSSEGRQPTTPSTANRPRLQPTVASVSCQLSFRPADPLSPKVCSCQTGMGPLSLGVVPTCTHSVQVRGAVPPMAACRTDDAMLIVIACVTWRHPPSRSAAGAPRFAWTPIHPPFTPRRAESEVVELRVDRASGSPLC
jgi:hypothetical protein